MNAGGDRPARKRAPRSFPGWAAVAELVADNQSRPVLLLDRPGLVRLVNRLGAELLAASREQLVGRRFVELLADAEEREAFERAMRDALRGPWTECEVQALDGRRLRAVLDLAPFGRGRRGGLVVTVASSSPISEEGLPQDLDYEISSDLSHFGRLQHVVAGGRRVPHLAGRLCYEALRGQKVACSDCPALRVTVEWPRVVVRRASGSYEVIEATPHGRSTTRLRLRRFTNEMLSAVFEARLAELAEEADLTEREHGVLKYLVMGRQLSDIATILGIALRTVKFHQGNILRKLGADSRLDLMRLMM